MQLAEKLEPVFKCLQKLDKRFAFIGIITLFIPILILPYYSVIGGWVVHFAYMFISGQGMQTANPDYFAGFISQPGWPILFLAIFLGLTAIIVMLGVKRGIELTCKIFMPLLVLITVGFSNLYYDTARCYGRCKALSNSKLQ